MATKFLDLTGVSHLYGKIKTLIETKTNDAIVSLKSFDSFASGAVWRIYYTTQNGEEKTFAFTAPQAGSESQGIITAKNFNAWEAKLDAEDVTLQLENGVIELMVNGSSAGSIDTTDFVIDGMLQDAELITVAEADVTDDCPTAGKYLKLTFNADANSKVVYVDVTDLIDIYSLVGTDAVAGIYLTTTAKVTGSGTVADPWKVKVEIDESELEDTIDALEASIASMQETIEGIVSTGGEANKVDDVTVNGESIVSGKVAKLVDATTTVSGLMSASDKQKLDGIDALTTDEIDAVFE